MEREGNILPMMNSEMTQNNTQEDSYLHNTFYSVNAHLPIGGFPRE